jgi:hypothetical protein
MPLSQSMFADVVAPAVTDTGVLGHRGNVCVTTTI